MATAAEKSVNWRFENVVTLKLDTQTSCYPEYTGLVLLSTDMLIVVERYARELLLYNRHNGHLLARLDNLKSNPYNICPCVVQGTETAVAVTLDNGQIQILSVVSTDQSAVITTVRTLNLTTQFAICKGVKALKPGDNLLVSGFIDEWFCWGIVSIENGPVNTVYKICKGRHWTYLATSPNDSIVYISCLAGLDSPNNGVYAFNVSTGIEKCVYQHIELKNPSGISVDKRGFIYVGNYSHPSSIHQLTESGETVRVYRDEMLYGLYVVYWEEQSGDLYVTRYQMNEIRRLRPEFSYLDPHPK